MEQEGALDLMYVHSREGRCHGVDCMALMTVGQAKPHSVLSSYVQITFSEHDKVRLAEDHIMETEAVMVSATDSMETVSIISDNRPSSDVYHVLHVHVHRIARTR